jgi:hypothetical protein
VTGFHFGIGVLNQLAFDSASRGLHDFLVCAAGDGSRRKLVAPDGAGVLAWA